MVVVKFLVFVSEVVSIFSQILTWIIGRAKGYLCPQLNYWGRAPRLPPPLSLRLWGWWLVGRGEGSENGVGETETDTWQSTDPVVVALALGSVYTASPSFIAVRRFNGRRRRRLCWACLSAICGVHLFCDGALCSHCKRHLIRFPSINDRQRSQCEPLLQHISWRDLY